MNGDILTDIDLSEAYHIHKKNKALATLILHDYRAFNKIGVDHETNIVDIPVETPSERSGRLAFTGIHIIDPALLTHIPDKVFSDIIDCYRGLIRSGISPKAHIVKDRYWRDLGAVNSYMLANREALQEDYVLIAPNCRIPRSAMLREWAVIGEYADLGEKVEIRRSILWDRVKVKRGVKIRDSVVTSSREVASDLIDGIL
jgi:NDP-sugar pyrophosphorylase family protein